MGEGSKLASNAIWHRSGAIVLEIRLDTRARGTIEFALLRSMLSDDGRLLITSGCPSFEEMEGQMNSLQDELDEPRERVRRAFHAALPLRVPVA